jgi:large repetitive protein
VKRLLLILAAVVGLILLGSVLASNSTAPHVNQGGPAPFTIFPHGPASRAVRRLPACPASGATRRAVHMLAAPGQYLLVDPPSAAPRAVVVVRGGGFAPGVALHLSARAPGQARHRLRAVKPQPDGSFCTTITVPGALTAPAVEVVAQDVRGHRTAATLVLPIAQPLAGLAPKVVTPGQRAAVWAVNFRPGETVRVYAERLAGRPILTGVIDPKGHGYWPLAVAYGPGGINQIVVIGDQGHAPVVAPYLLLSLYPHAGVSNYAPQPGKRITFYGGGFGPYERVELRLDRPAGPVLAVARANAGGGLRRLGPYGVPFGLAGVHTFILHGVDSHVTTTVDVLVEPFFANARPSTYAAGPGTTLTFYGGGFAPHEIVRVYLSRTGQSAGTEVAALRTTATGQLVGGSGSYALPATLQGPTLTFGLVGDISGAVASTTVHYLAPPGSSVLVGTSPTYRSPTRQHAPPVSTRMPVLVATPPRVLPGGRLSLSGSGFPAHDEVRLVLGSNDNPNGWALGTVRSGADGTLNTTVTMPPGVTRADMVQAYSGAGGASATARAELAVWPTAPHLTASAESGPAGAAYSLSGDGFTPGEQVSLYLDSIATTPLATTTSGGRIAFNGLRVPVTATGNHTFIVKGTYGDIAAVSFMEWAVTPYLLLSTYSTLPERPVSVSGKGFVPGETVHLFLNGTLVGRATADDRGALRTTAAFTIPPSARGPLQVTVVGAQSGRPARATLDVLPFEPSLWLSSYAGHPGTTVAFTGTGFARNDTMHVYAGGATKPAATFPAHNGAFRGAGAVRIPFGTPAGVLRLTVHGARSDVGMTLRFRVVPFTPGAGYEVRHRGPFTVLRLGAGGFAPYEPVRLYRGTDPNGTPLRLLHVDAAGNLPLLRVLVVRGTPRTRLAYTLVGMQSGARATAVYTPHATGHRKPPKTDRR